MEVMAAPLTANISLIVEIAILILLIIGIKFGREKTAQGLKRHRDITAIMVVLNAAPIILVMIPSLVGAIPALYTFTTLGIILLALHSASGGLAEALGVAFVIEKKPKSIKRWMRITTTVWAIALSLGFIEYLQVASILII